MKSWKCIFVVLPVFPRIAHLSHVSIITIPFITLNILWKRNCWCYYWFIFYIHKSWFILVFTLMPLTVFKNELDKDVAGDTSGNFAKLLLALVQVSFISAFFFFCWFFVCFLINASCPNCHVASDLSAGQTTRAFFCSRLWKDRPRCQSRLKKW